MTKERGFTFVEAMVVAVIMAILAMVAVPMYNGYIRNQRQQAALAVAQTASVTASSLKRRNGAVTTADLNGALTLPNAAQFTVTVENGNTVRVIEKSNPSDPVQADVQF